MASLLGRRSRGLGYRHLDPLDHVGDRLLLRLGKGRVAGKLLQCGQRVGEEAVANAAGDLSDVGLLVGRAGGESLLELRHVYSAGNSLCGARARLAAPNEGEQADQEYAWEPMSCLDCHKKKRGRGRPLIL